MNPGIAEAELALTRRGMLQAGVAFSLFPLAEALRAEDARALRIGIAAPATTLDPHLQNNGPNNALASHIFDSLVINDEKSRSKPGLAASWKTLDDTHWEFTLRDGVVFSDGTPFGFEDAKVSVARASTLASSSSFRAYTRSVKAITPGAARNTLIVETHVPDPMLLNSLSRIRIISARFKDAPSADFDGGKAAIGTGPFALKEYVPGSHTLLKRNGRHWGAKPAWDDVLLRIVSDSGARIAGLLSGDLDLIENVPAESLGRIRSDKRLRVITGVSSRVVLAVFDLGREVTPFATDAAGKPLPRNPFLDPKVRRAIDCAINRQAIVERVMEGQATVAAQYLPTGAPGTSSKLRPTAYDPNKAKALLNEAGFPKGFKLTVHGPNDRFINDGKILQAIAQMLTRIGIETRVELAPWSIYAAKMGKSEFSFFLTSFGVNTGETSNPLIANNASFDPKAGLGAANFGRYSNPALDAKLKQALPILDDAARNQLLAEASGIVFEDRAVLPLHFEGLILAAKQGIQYTTRADQYTLATGVTKG